MGSVYRGVCKVRGGLERYLQIIANMLDDMFRMKCRHNLYLNP